jgi:uncharacterized protein (TIGR01777 family)
VHLAGAGVADRRWTPAYKEQVRCSRIDGTTAVAEAVAAAGTPVLLSASGVNWYGDTGDRLTDETGPPGAGFLAEVCRQWEATTQTAAAAGVRVVNLRTGVVLTRRGGALARQLPVFRAGLGAPLGDGHQWLSWISLDDEVAAIRHLLAAPVAGPVNLVSPSPVTNRDFTRALGRALHRPTLPVPVPRLALRLGFGEVVDEVLVVGQRLAPHVLTDSGFEWKHVDLDGALRAALSDRGGAGVG